MCAHETQAACASERIDRFLGTHVLPTPFITIDLDKIRDNYASLRQLFPQARIFYAIKANPAAEVIAALANLGASFDLASEGEIERCCTLRINSDRLSFGNTIKREEEIKHARSRGIDLFAFDSISELEKLARAAPGARVFCRLLVKTVGADWPLTRKFGCSCDMATDLLERAGTLGLEPIGVSFHVGSQQTDPQQWRTTIADAERVFGACARRGLNLRLLNIGGGFPAHYRTPVPPLSTYAEVIETALARAFGGARPDIVVEPGRYLVGDAGVLRSQVLLVARKSRYARRRWVYVDAGRYNGLTETQNERIQYRVRTSRDGTPGAPVVLAGPTCDSTDILYEHAGYALPLDLAAGDFVDFLSAGAYTASYASVEFNGFVPVKTYCI